jgi:hypothetical protein
MRMLSHAAASRPSPVVEVVIITPARHSLGHVYALHSIWACDDDCVAGVLVCVVWVTSLLVLLMLCEW